MKPRALIYVQHLLGIGHLARARRIARSLAEAGVRTTIAQGGTEAGLEDVPGVEVVRLTPAKVAAGDMTTLLHADGRPFTAQDKLGRRDELLALLRRSRPDILLVEAFPFGRRQMRFELIALLDEAKAMGVPVVASSIRDILQETRKPGRAEEAVALVDAYFDIVLVHGDEALTPLGMTFPLASAIRSKTRYTGLVGPDRSPARPSGHAVVVSAGGGGVGGALLEAAVAAAPLTSLGGEAWLVLTGPNLPDAEFARLQAIAAASAVRLTVKRSVPDLAARLAGARVSVSQAGYNTVADVLVSGCAAVLVPFASGGETEQSARAAALAAAGRVVVVREAELTPESMAGAIDLAVRAPAAAPMRLNGGRRTAAILVEELLDRKAPAREVETRRALRSSPSRETP